MLVLWVMGHHKASGVGLLHWPFGFALLQCQWGVFAAPGAPVGHVWVGPLGVAPLQSQWGGFVALAFDILQHCNGSGLCLLHPVWL